MDITVEGENFNLGPSFLKKLLQPGTTGNFLKGGLVLKSFFHFEIFVYLDIVKVASYCACHKIHVKILLIKVLLKDVASLQIRYIINK